jgi:hypothetical protein
MTWTITTTIAACTIAAVTASAQELEPRAYSPAPVGTTFLVVGYTWSSGSVLTDPTLPITDGRATVEGGAVGIGRAFDLLGSLANFSVAVPFARADFSAAVNGAAASATRAGLADTRLRLAVNVLGNRALQASEFARTPRRPTLGLSVVVQAPSGQYDNGKLINLGNHRWAFKPEAGVSVPIRRLDADLYVAGWFFGDNDHFFPGDAVRTQDPIVSLQAHVSFTVRPRLWLAADATWYRGGSSRAGDGLPSAELNNSRAGMTLSVPLGGRYSLKAAYTSGVTVRTGTNFNTISVTWQAAWIPRP